MSRDVGEQALEAGPDDLVIVGDQQSDGHRGNRPPIWRAQPLEGQVSVRAMRRRRRNR